jgi:hypothetical protein
MGVFGDNLSVKRTLAVTEVAFSRYQRLRNGPNTTTTCAKLAQERDGVALTSSSFVQPVQRRRVRLPTETESKQRRFLAGLLAPRRRALDSNLTGLGDTAIRSLEDLAGDWEPGLHCIAANEKQAGAAESGPKPRTFDELADPCQLNQGACAVRHDRRDRRPVGVRAVGCCGGACCNRLFCLQERS